MGHANQPLWDRIKNKVQQGSKGGLPGQWSARKAQLLVKEYKDKGGKFTGEKNPNNSLTKWTQQNWRTKSGKPSLKTGERYLPYKAIKSLTSAEYARTTRKKREGMRKGKQFVGQPFGIRNKTRKFRLF
jgi:hypothetical protein